MTHRKYNNLIKELIWWIQERWETYKFIRGLRMLEKRSTKGYSTTFNAVKGRFGVVEYLGMTPVTKEAKKHMDKVHKERGRSPYYTKEEMEKMTERLREFNSRLAEMNNGRNIKEAYKTKGRIGGVK